MYLHKQLSNSKLHPRFSDPGTLFSVLSFGCCAFLQTKPLFMEKAALFPNPISVQSITRSHHFTAQGHHTHTITRSVTYLIFNITYYKTLVTILNRRILYEKFYLTMNVLEEIPPGGFWNYLNRYILLLDAKMIRDMNRFPPK